MLTYPSGIDVTPRGLRGALLVGCMAGKGPSAFERSFHEDPLNPRKTESREGSI